MQSNIKSTLQKTRIHTYVHTHVSLTNNAYLSLHSTFAVSVLEYSHMDLDCTTVELVCCLLYTYVIINRSVSICTFAVAHNSNLCKMHVACVY